MKVHRLICLELKNYIDRIEQIFSSIESARPRCASGIKALCSLLDAMDKAKLLILHCSESSKLYLAITGDRILLRCERIREILELSLSQIQNEVPSLLAAQISGIVDDLKIATFTMESSEDEAGKILLELLHQDIAASDSPNMSEFKALQLASLRLHIKSPMAVLIEKRCIKRLLQKIRDTDPNKEKILNYLLYLLRKYGKSIGGYGKESTSLSQSIDLVHVENSEERAQVDVLDTPEPPEQFKCPLSSRLMYDPVIIANGKTFERIWIKKWFDEGHETCPMTHMKLPDLSLTPNDGIKNLISGWCTKQGITVPEPCSQPTFAAHRLQKLSSSTSIASFGSSVNGLRLQISNVSFRSSDTNCGFDSVDANIDNGSRIGGLPRMNPDRRKFQASGNSHGIDLAFLSKLAALPWESQRKAVEDVKDQLKDNHGGSNSMISNSYVKPLIRFLKDARDLQDSKAQRDGAQLLLTFLSEIRNEMPPLQEDAIYVLSSLLDSETTEDALAIMELLSIQQYYKAMILASGVLPSILRIIEQSNTEYCLLAMKILYNLSSISDIGHHMVYLDYVAKLAPFLGNRVLAGYCIKILKNLCNTEEARVSIAESTACISSMTELLEIGTSEEQELTLDVLLSLCSHCSEYCQLFLKDSTISSIVHLSVNGNEGGVLLAADLLHLLRDFTGWTSSGVNSKISGLKPEISQDSVQHVKQKTASKSSKLRRGRRVSILSRPQS